MTWRKGCISGVVGGEQHHHDEEEEDGDDDGVETRRDPFRPLSTHLGHYGPLWTIYGAVLGAYMPVVVV